MDQLSQAIQVNEMKCYEMLVCTVVAMVMWTAGGNFVKINTQTQHTRLNPVNVGYALVYMRVRVSDFRE